MDPRDIRQKMLFPIELMVQTQPDFISTTAVGSPLVRITQCLHLVITGGVVDC